MKTDIAKFRLRGFTCKHCTVKQEVFGQETAPKNCAVCEAPLPDTPDYDFLITEKKTTEPYPGNA